MAGLEGLALLRAEVEGSEPGFFDARFAELATILAARNEARLDQAPKVTPIDTVAGYSVWASTYDGPNPLVELEEPPVRNLLDSAPPGVVLDAATGTGRYADYLTARGHVVVGVDNCPAMLDVARAKVPEAEFRLGPLVSLPMEDDAVDLVVCALALTHQPDLRPVFAEFARVLRPGGRLITSDIHYLSLYLGGVADVLYGDGRVGRMAASRFLPSDYLRAGLEVGYTPASCQEIPWPDLAEGHGGPTVQQWCPGAARAAYVGMPATIIWDLRLA